MRILKFIIVGDDFIVVTICDCNSISVYSDHSIVADDTKTLHVQSEPLYFS